MKIVHEVLFFVSAVAFASVMFFCTGCALTDGNFELKEDSTVKELNEKLANLEKENSDLTKENKSLLEKIEYLTSQKKYYEDALVTLKEEYSYYMSIYTIGDAELADIIAKYEELIKEYNAKIDSLEGEISDYKKTIKELKKIIEAKESEIISINDNYRTVYLELQKYIELYNNSKDDTDEVINGYKKRIVELTKEIEELIYKLSVMTGKYTDLSDKYSELEEKYTKLEKDFLDKNNTIEGLKKQIEELEKENKQLREDLQKKPKDIYLHGYKNGDIYNWKFGKVVVNNVVDIKNGCIEYDGYIIHFIEA